MDALAAGSFAAYRALVYETPGFTDFFWAATPISEIVQLNIGSRPASRTASRAIEDLRAIPWVFSWSQARFMLPGWFGFAGGVDARRPDHPAADRSGRRVRRLRRPAVEHGAGPGPERHVDRRALRRPRPDVPNGGAIMDAIRAEHEQAIDIALAIRGGSQLLDDRPDLLESVELAAQAVDPLNFLQLELLSRRRAGDEDEQLRLAIQLTVAGVAAGLRNTG